MDYHNFPGSFADAQGSGNKATPQRFENHARRNFRAPEKTRRLPAQTKKRPIAPSSQTEILIRFKLWRGLFRRNFSMRFGESAPRQPAKPFDIGLPALPT